MYFYQAYGLGIYSNMALPELVPAEVNGDVFIQLKEPNEGENIKTGINQLLVKINKQRAVVSTKNIGTFVIREGSQVEITPVLQADTSSIRSFVIGTIMGIVLYQRGLFVLHASSVHIDNRGVAFLGASGSGKSSLAAAVYTRGHNFIADDVSSLNIKGSIIELFPGFPQIKLAPESAQSLGLDYQTMRVLGDLSVERGYRLEERFDRTPAQLSGIYVLEDSSAQSFQRLSAQESVLELVRHSLPTRFAHTADEDHFLRCIQLAREIPIYRLNRPSSLRGLPELARSVEEHFRTDVLGG
jgi:serine kinase of HPr protein (carbohydrate metabolism regulator)